MTKRTQHGTQQDAHCDVFDKYLQDQWEDFPPDISEMTAQVTTEVTQDMYVIAKSDSVENLYWGDWPVASWRSLLHAARYTREQIALNPEPLDGFWMPLERAEELDQ